MHGVIMLAAGSGERMGDKIPDKILEPIGPSNAFNMSLYAFAHVEKIQAFVIVFRDEKQMEMLKREVNRSAHSLSNKIILFVRGGKERSDSVRNGLNELPENCEFVHIHDCARPMIRRETIETLVNQVSQNKAIVVARPVTNTIRRKLSREELALTETLPRNELWEMETPQSGPRAWFTEGYSKAQELNLKLTDDMHAIELLPQKIMFLEAGYPNPKITHPQDIKFVSYLMNNE